MLFVVHVLGLWRVGFEIRLFGSSCKSSSGFSDAMVLVKLVADSRWRERGELSTMDRVDYRRCIGDNGLGGSQPRGRKCSMDGYWWLDRWSSNGEQRRSSGDQSLVDAMVGRGERDVAG
ncbi:hypothetical protein L6452_41237 [Arctium lappa]|uniref:Uncharacterized protein n=1 Tax=Arctium lappa TaxID=4217 RepID=A0ACB8XNM3_ARCLA|nr:hypothetical protein L6452_41237 [Arctium lappa]